MDTSRRAAFAALYDDTADSVLGYLRRRTDSATAEDLATETYLALWARWDSGGSEAGVGWIIGIARRLLANARRTDRRADLRLARLDRPEPAAFPEDNIVTGHAVRAVLAQLSSDDREVLELAYWEQLDHHELAAALSCFPAAARARLSRARRRFKALAQAAGLPLVEDGMSNEPPKMGRRSHEGIERTLTICPDEFPGAHHV